jgi:serine/threonine protein kinase
MSLEAGTLLGPYEILGPLAAGGMGEVYRARDTRLERQVAVKVLPARVADEAARRERFEREARAIASLAHPNVCVLFDVGMHAGSPYLVMEYLEGETLAERIARGPLPIGEALRLAGQIAEGLAAAHERGVIHRDLKPANVKITPDGRAKVLDFGLARRREPEAPAGVGDEEATAAAPVTGANSVMGTAGYMSPEQARGRPVDQRTDVWALGTVVFEMLTGRRLFVGTSVADLLVSVLQQDIRLDELPEGTPAEVRQALARCLARDADRRLADMRELAALFGRGAAGTRPSVAAVPARGGAQRSRSIAVLPFANLSPDPENEYFSDGLTEEVIADLSKLGSLRVISRSTAMRFKGGTHDLRQVADELDVGHVLEGSVRKAGNNVRITAQLVDVETVAPVWSDKFSGTLDDVFEIQEKVSRSIVDALRIELTDSESEALRERPAADGEAYDVYLRTRRDIWGFTREGLDRAMVELERARERAPESPLLLSRLATAHWQYFNAGHDTDPARLAKAEVEARRLRTLDPDGHYADFLLTLVNLSRGRIFDAVEHGIRSAERAPRDPDANAWVAFALTMGGCPERARSYLDRVREIDPLFDFLHAGLGFVAFVEGQFGQAIAHYDRARSLTPEQVFWPLLMAQAAASGGDHERVRRIARQWAGPPGAQPLAALSHMLLQATRGERTLLDRTMDEAYRAKLWPDLQYCHLVSQIYALVGDVDESLRWLEQSTRRGWLHYPFLADRDRALDNLRGDPRFATLLQRVHGEWTEFRARFG